MPTTLDQVLGMQAIEVMQDPEWAKTLAEICKKLNTGFYEKWLIDCLTQQWSGNKAGYDLYDAYAFAIFWSDMIHGRIAHAIIESPGCPKADEAVDENNAILATLPPPFQASFFGGKGDDDGDLSWDLPIALTVTDLDSNGAQIVRHITLEPGFAPLEVGYTQPARTLGHLRTEGFLARWPYNQSRIGLFVQLSIGTNNLFG